MEGNGLASEIIKKAFEVEGINVEIVFYPWKRCEVMLQHQKLDAIFPYTRTDERADMYDFSEPVVVVRTHFFYLKKKIDHLHFTQYEDLQPYSIGGILGYFYEDIFKQAGLHVEYVSKGESWGESWGR